MKTQNNQLQLTSVAQENEEASCSPSHHALRPSVTAAVTINSFLSPGEHSSLPALLDELDTQTKDIWAGNLNRPEAMLSAQAHSLDAIYNVLAQKAGAALKSGNLASTEAYLRMALKAQGQCRMTLEALGELKSPKSAMFIRQANIADQQVNQAFAVNGAPSHTHAHVKITDEFLTNKLLEVQHGERMDGRTASTAISNDSKLEAMAEILRPKNRSRKSYGGKKCD